MADVNGRLAVSVPDKPPLSRRDLRSRHPGEKQRRPGCKGQRRFAPALFVVAAGSCSFLTWCRFTHLIPFAGAETSTTRLAVHALLAHGHKNFLPEPAKTFHVRHGRLHRAVLVYALAANGSQTGEGNNQRSRAAGPRKTSKPRPRQLNG